MIADIIHKLAEFEREDYTYTPRPSQAGPDRCIRQMVYHGLNIARQPLPGRSIHVFNDSSWHEELTADWIRKSTYKLHSEQMTVEVGMNGLVISGHIDYIATDLQGKDTLIEHKAINHFTFEKYKHGELPMDYLTQTCLYLRGIHAIQPECTSALLLVKNKNTSAYLEFNIDYDDEHDVLTINSILCSDGTENKVNQSFPDICKNAFDKFMRVQEYIKTKTLPKRQYELNHWRCDYCQWGAVCWDNWEEEIEKMATDQQLDEEIATAAGHYQECKMHMDEIKKEQEEAKRFIKDRLKDQNIRSGRAGEYVISIDIRHNKEHVVKASSYEVLSIRKPKKEKK